MIYPNGKLFTAKELKEIRAKFEYTDRDFLGNERLFFDNAGGSLRLKEAAEAFDAVNRIPDASEHSNKIALHLEKLEEEAKEDIMKTVFNASRGRLYPSYTASQILMETIRIISGYAKGDNYVTTVLEHPSAFDAMTRYAAVNGCDLRIAEANNKLGGVDAESIVSLIDKKTAILCCMAASNISGYIYPLENICRRAREINPDIYIVVDAVQHAPHGVLDPTNIGADVMVFAPYKFFGTRGMGIAYLSDRVASFEHTKLEHKAADDWEIGSPATPHFASFQKIIDYVVWIGSQNMPAESSRRTLYENGMKRIADHERALLDGMLNGFGRTEGLRCMKGVRVHMDCLDLTKRDLIMGIEFENMGCEDAVRELEERGVVTFERSASSFYSKRMLDAFGLNGVVRVSPLHVNTPEEIERFLEIVKEVSLI